MDPALLILAAGIGSRYGSMKQVDAIGASGEMIMDYSIYDAQRVGIKRIVFVVNRNSERKFRELIDSRYKGEVDIDYVIQEASPVQERTKPLGTGHAVLSASEKIKGAFIVINADDFYGLKSFKAITDYLASLSSDKQTEFGLVGFSLRNTLSENGSVSRAICEEDSGHYLKTITERTNISRSNDRIVYKEDDAAIEIDGNSIVSLNMLGFTSSIFPKLEEQFELFLSKNKNNLDKEFFLPDCVDEMIKSSYAKVKVIRSNEEWFGLTYKEDKLEATSRINKLIAMGEYPKNLFH